MLPNMVAEHSQGPGKLLALLVLISALSHGRWMNIQRKELGPQVLKFELEMTTREDHLRKPLVGSFPEDADGPMDNNVYDMEVKFKQNYDENYKDKKVDGNLYSLNYMYKNFSGLRPTSTVLTSRCSGAWIGTMNGRKKDWDLQGAECQESAEDWSLRSIEVQQNLEDWHLQNYETEFNSGMINWSSYGELHGGGIYILDYLVEKFFDIDFVHYFEMVILMVTYVVNYIQKNVMVQMALGIASCVFAALVAHRAWEKRKRRKRLDQQHHLGHGYGSIRRSRKWDAKVPMRWRCKMRLRGILLLGLMGAGQAMDQQQAAFATDVLNQVASLVRAANEASQATTGALRAFQAHQEKSESRPRTGDITKILKQPEVFSEDDPVKYVIWREQFLNWICFLDKKYESLFQEVERLDQLADDADMNEESKVMGQQLYSILASYLRGPAGQLVRKEAQTRNGFRVWQALQKLFIPRTRQRTMALGQAIMQHPSFSSGKSMVDNLLQFEQLLEQYQYASGHAMAEDLVISTLLKCVDAPTRKHLQLTIDETTTYERLKDLLIQYDRNSRTWSSDTIMKGLQLQYHGGDAAASSSGPTPMEVDRVHDKGKGKKGHGKKGWNFPFGGKWGGGKSSKGKKGKKGKSKGKGKKGGKKGKSQFWKGRQRSLQTLPSARALGKWMPEPKPSASSVQQQWQWDSNDHTHWQHRQWQWEKGVIFYNVNCVNFAKQCISN